MALQLNPTRNEMGDDKWDLWQDGRETQDQDSIDIDPTHRLEDTSSATEHQPGFLFTDFQEQGWDLLKFSLL